MTGQREKTDRERKKWQTERERKSDKVTKKK